MYARASDVVLLDAPHFEDERGQLVQLCDESVPFPLARAFLVRGTEDAVRGGHAHRRCSQLLVAVSGSIRVDYTDGQGAGTALLTAPETALLLPPMIWATQVFHGRSSNLLVLCDRPFEVDDYVRDRDEFLSLRRIAASKGR